MALVETRQMLQLALGLCGLSVFSYLYALGVREGASKALRRYVGSALFVVICLIIAKISGVFSWWMLLS